MNLDIPLMLESIPSLYSAAIVTIKLTVLSSFFGLLLGAILSLLRYSHSSALRRFAATYSLIFRGTPLIVQLFIIYYGLAQASALRESPLWIVFKDPVRCAVIALGLNSAAYTSEIIRAAVNSVPKGQWEAAKVLGLGQFLVFRLVVAPQALRFALPSYGNEIIMLMKGTALASTISLFDLTGRAKTLVAETYAPYEIFILVALIYLLLGLALQSLVKWGEAKVRLPSPSG
ncbi:ABC transporter permease [Aliirhizobium smilacinae]|nr:ABC transporter permease subunit [Rhizobium smilacinae]